MARQRAVIISRLVMVKLADVGCTKPKVDTKQHVSI